MAKGAIMKMVDFPGGPELASLTLVVDTGKLSKPVLFPFSGNYIMTVIKKWHLTDG
jgi:hypothetical protein